MKLAVLIIFSVFFAYKVSAQLYGAYDIGYALKAKSPIISLHIGYELNNIFHQDGVGLIEYNQRIMTGGTSSKYLGGRVGYGYYLSEVSMISFWGGKFRNLTSSNSKNFTPWISGYGASYFWKSFSLEVNKVEFYQISIGCRVLIDFSEY